jgi:O-acetyl-ADP-ribose deacetylase (regulator of RNase III)
MVTLLAAAADYGGGITLAVALVGGGILRGIVRGKRQQRAMRQAALGRAAVDPAYARALNEYFARGGKW